METDHTDVSTVCLENTMEENRNHVGDKRGCTWGMCTLWQTKILSCWVSREIIELGKLFIPITLSLVFTQLPLFMSLFFVGWINDKESSLNLDAAALGSSFVNITGYAVIYGLSTAADTLSSQTYGFGNYKHVGVIFQRGLFFLLFVSAFIACVWLNGESILLLFQQKPCVASYAALYINIFILVLPPLVLYIALQKFLQTQSIVWPFIITGLLMNVINVVGHAVFIFGLNLGIEGAAAALVIANVAQPVILIIYVKIRKLHKKTWGGWSLESLEEWPEYIKLAVPGMLMVLAEWASFEISTLVVGAISEVELAVNGIIVSYATLLFMIPYGISVAVSIRVGNELGAGNAKRAKRAVYISLGIMAVDVAVVICVTFSLRSYIGNFYNAEEQVRERLQFAIYILCIELFGDQIQAVLSGVLRGAGHQFRGAIINLTAYYVFGLPVGITLALVADMGVVGMWIGLAVATNIQAVSIGTTLLCLNWTKEAEKAMKRASSQVASEKPKLVNSSSTETVELTQYNQNNDENVLEDAVDKTVEEEGFSDVPIEEVPLVVADEDNDDIVDNTTALVDDSEQSGSVEFIKSRTKPRLKLISCHISLVVVACVCLLASGIASMYHPPDSIVNGNYSNCSTDTDIE